MTGVELIRQGGDPVFVVTARSPHAEFAALAELAAGPPPTEAEVAKLVAAAEKALEIPDDEDNKPESEDTEGEASPEESSDPLEWPDRLRVHAGVPLESTQDRDRRTDVRRGHAVLASILFDERRVVTVSGEEIPGGWDAYLTDEHRHAAQRRTTYRR